MTSKKRFRNKYQLLLRERDHPPAHVHLLGGGLDVSIDLSTFECAGDCPRDPRNEVVAWVKEHQEEPIRNWNKWHR
ncbi:MAG: DUF4160 domain-containing protein [Betaproteobacteria bacterium]|nr:DUF4160 domain-containing protein [Betaproteobacteria bacterium]